MAAHCGETGGVPAMRNLVGGSKPNRLPQLALGVGPIAIVVQPDKTEGSMALSQIRISLHRARGGFLCSLPSFRWRWLHKPIEQSKAICELGVRQRKIRIKSDSAL